MPTGSSLWDQAVQQLSAEETAVLNVAVPEKLALLEAVIESANEKQRFCVDRRWKFTNHKGKVIVIRDLVQKIVNCAKTFIAIGDQAMAYDPGYAALPWAAVRFFLQVVINDSEEFGAIMEAMECISGLTTRYRIMEDLYLRSPQNSLHQEFESSLTGLYGIVLSHVAKAKEYYRTNTTKRLLTSTFRGAGAWSQEFQSRISAQETIIDRYARLLDAQRQTDSARDLHVRDKKFENLLQNLNRPTDRLELQLVAAEDRLEEAQRVKILHKISHLPYREHHKTASKGRLEGSGQWLLEDGDFKEWRSSSSSSWLWIHGIPGAGKTVLASIVIDHVLGSTTSTASAMNGPVVYFYSSRNASEPERSQPVAVLQSLVRQLARIGPSGPFQEPLRKRYAGSDPEDNPLGSLDMDECTVLLAELTDLHLLTTIVIDALDECQPDTRIDLLHCLIKVQALSASLVKIFITSRRDFDIVDFFNDEKTPNVSIEAANNSLHIKGFVSTTLNSAISTKKLLYGKVTNDLRDLIEEILMHLADSTRFLWVTFQISMLCDKRRIRREEDVRLELGRLPEDLKIVYERIWDDIAKLSSSSRDLAETVLAWILCAKEQLNTDTLLIAFRESTVNNQYPVTKDDVLSICNNLVVWDDISDTFRLAHPSVREYLLTRTLEAEAEAHSRIMRGCVTSLLRYRYEQGEKMSRTTSTTTYATPVGYYAATTWLLHCQQSSLVANEAEFEACLGDFLSLRKPHPAFEAWTSYALGHELHHIKMYKSLWILRRCIAMPANPIFMSTIFGFAPVMNRASTLDFTKSNIDGYDAVSLAARYGSLATLDLILSRGVPLPARSDPHRQATPLILAAELNDLSVVAYLVQRTPNLDEADADGETALSCAASRGRLDAVRLLVESGAAFDSGPDSAMASAALCGYHNVSKYLSERVADSNHVNVEHSAVLEDTAIKGVLKLQPDVN